MQHTKKASTRVQELQHCACTRVEAISLAAFLRASSHSSFFLLKVYRIIPTRVKDIDAIDAIPLMERQEQGAVLISLPIYSYRLSLQCIMNPLLNNHPMSKVSPTKTKRVKRAVWRLARSGSRLLIK